MAQKKETTKATAVKKQAGEIFFCWALLEIKESYPIVQEMGEWCRQHNQMLVEGYAGIGELLCAMYRKFEELNALHPEDGCRLEGGGSEDLARHIAVRAVKGGKQVASFHLHLERIRYVYSMQKGGRQ